jgi:lipoprotein-anchoring transpeptidase ErfK/SrfK
MAIDMTTKTTFTIAVLAAAGAFACAPANAQLLYAPQGYAPVQQAPAYQDYRQQAYAPAPQNSLDQQYDRQVGDEDALIQRPELQRQIVDYRTTQPAGTIVIDTPHTFLYFVLGNGKAIRYGIGVGREGFTWSGVKSVARKAEWPDWYPPAEMIARQPYLPRMTAGGPGNPLGARAMYIGGTEYRIHGTNDPTTIGKHVSSGCIRLTNEDVMDLYNRVQVGAKVVVLPQKGPAPALEASAPAKPQHVSAAAPQRQPTQIADSSTGVRPFGLY